MSGSGPTKTIDILLVEDNPEDADWTEETLRRIPCTRVSVVEDGVAALAFLRREAKYVTEVKPHVILLDMRLPKKNGWEVLEEIERDLGLRLIPVVVMTGVDTETDDAVRAIKMGASDFITKPVDEKKFLEIVGKIIESELQKANEERKDTGHLKEWFGHTEGWTRDEP